LRRYPHGPTFAPNNHGEIESNMSAKCSHDTLAKRAGDEFIVIENPLDVSSLVIIHDSSRPRFSTTTFDS